MLVSKEPCKNHENPRLWTRVRGFRPGATHCDRSRTAWSPPELVLPLKATPSLAVSPLMRPPSPLKRSAYTPVYDFSSHRRSYTPPFLLADPAIWVWRGRNASRKGRGGAGGGAVSGLRGASAAGLQDRRGRQWTRGEQGCAAPGSSAWLFVALRVAGLDRPLKRHRPAFFIVLFVVGVSGACLYSVLRYNMRLRQQETDGVLVFFVGWRKYKKLLVSW